LISSWLRSGDSTAQDGEPLKLKNNPDATNLTEAVKEYQIPSRLQTDGVRVPVSPTVLVDPTRNPIPLVSGFTWDGVPTLEVDVAQPAVNTLPGGGTVYTVPVGYRAKIETIQFRLVTSAVAGNRVCEIYAANAGGLITDMISWIVTTSAQTASLDTYYTLVNNGMYALTTGLRRSLQVSIPELPPGFRIIMTWSGNDAGDQWSVTRIMVKLAPA